MAVAPKAMIRTRREKPDNPDRTGHPYGVCPVRPDILCGQCPDMSG
jgi:hypothetical protein